MYRIPDSPVQKPVHARLYLLQSGSPDSVIHIRSPDSAVCDQSQSDSDHNSRSVQICCHKGPDLILRRKMGESRFTQIAETKELTYTDARTVGDTLYYYSVQAVSGKWGNAVRSSYDKNISVKTQTTTPQPTPGQTVKLKTPAVTVTAGKKQAKLKWKKISNAQGYVVYRATSKNGKYKAVSTIKKGSTVSYTNKKLTSKKTYYYKVRAYRVVNGKKVYSGYSKVKGVKIK